MENSVVTQVVLPAALFVIMLGVGLTLSLEDFRRIWSQKRVVALGVSLQLVLLPLLGFLVVTLFQLPAGLAVGLMILTFAPGGATSNMITYLARGDTALSVSMTATVSLIAPFSLPLLAALALEHWFGQSQALAFPVVQTMGKLVVMTIIPVLLGVFLHHKLPMLCKRLQAPVKWLSMLFLLVVVAGIVKANWQRLPELTLQVGPAVLTLITLAFALGYLISRQLRCDTTRALTLGIEVGIQNAGTALLVTGTVLHNAEMSASALAYGILMNIPVFVLIIYRNWRTESTAAAA